MFYWLIINLKQQTTKKNLIIKMSQNKNYSSETLDSIPQSLYTFILLIVGSFLKYNKKYNDFNT